MVAHRLRGYGWRYRWVWYWWWGHRRHHVRVVGILSRHLGPWCQAACRAGKRRGWKVRWGFREALPARGLGERWPHCALVKSTGGLGRCWWGVLHEIRVWRHVSTVPMVARTVGGLGVIVVRGNRRLGRWRPQVGGSVVLRGAMLARGHSCPGSASVLMEGHDCGKRNSRVTMETLLQGGDQSNRQMTMETMFIV